MNEFDELYQWLGRYRGLDAKIDISARTLLVIMDAIKELQQTKPKTADAQVEEENRLIDYAMRRGLTEVVADLTIRQSERARAAKEAKEEADAPAKAEFFTKLVDAMKKPSSVAFRRLLQQERLLTNVIEAYGEDSAQAELVRTEMDKTWRQLSDEEIYWVNNVGVK